MSINLTTPKRWADLTEDQLIYVSGQLMSERTEFELAVRVFIYCCGIDIEKHTGEKAIVRIGKRYAEMDKELFIQGAESVQWITRSLIGFEPLRSLGDGKPCDSSFEGVEFEKYIACENWYQAYLATRSTDYLCCLAAELYGCASDRMRKESPERLFTAFLWYGGIKQRFAKEFPHYFRKVESGSSSGENMKMREMIFATMRALTGGDITKTENVLRADTWSALYELDSKAHETMEMEARINKMKSKRL